jgi:hypothetical protein
MVRQTPKPPTARISGWGGTGYPNGSRPFLSSAQLRGMRRQLTDLDAKLRQMTAAERERRR